MSIQLPFNDPAALREVGRRLDGMVGEVRNLLVFFGGHADGMEAGADLTPRDSNGERTSFTAFSALRKEFAKHTAKGMDPALSNNTWNDAVLNGIHFIRNVQRFDPRGKLVIYGFSAGGFNAVRLCERLQRHFGWYDFTTGTLGNIRRENQQHRERFAIVQVDLLITVDPCLQDLAGWPFDIFTPSPIVIRHQNFYQVARWAGDPNDPRRPYSGVSVAGADVHGCPLNPPASVVGSSPHDRMPNFTLDNVLRLVRTTLRTNQRH